MSSDWEMVCRDAPALPDGDPSSAENGTVPAAARNAARAHALMRATCFDADASRTPFMAVWPGQCRWPLGEPTSEEFRFCGAGILEKSVYCATHRGLAYGGRRA